MKRLALLGLAALFAFATAGCTLTRIRSHSPGYSAAPRPPTFALAVTVHGGLQPTAAQWAAIQARIAEELAWNGAVLVTDLSLADRIIRLDFHPNPLNPDSSGHLTILGVRWNPYRGIASSGILAGYSPGSSYSSSFSFARAFSRAHGWGSANYYSGDYFNYIGPWENGYTSGATPVATVPEPVCPPLHRERPIDREFCAPDALHPRPEPTFASSGGPRFATADAASFTHVSPASPSPSPSRRWTGEGSAWRSDASSPRAARTFARSDSGRSRSGRSYSHDSAWHSRAERSASSYSPSYERSYDSGPRFSSSDMGYTDHSPSPSPSYSTANISNASDFATSSNSPSPSPSEPSGDNAN